MQWLHFTALQVLLCLAFSSENYPCSPATPLNEAPALQAAQVCCIKGLQLRMDRSLHAWRTPEPARQFVGLFCAGHKSFAWSAVTPSSSS